MRPVCFPQVLAEPEPRPKFETTALIMLPLFTVDIGKDTNIVAPKYCCD